MNHLSTKTLTFALGVSIAGCNSDLRSRLDTTNSSLDVGGCAAGKWDHDADPRTDCASHTRCPAGTHVAFVGDSETDRLCEPCAPGTFSADSNSPICRPWRACPAGTFVDSPGHPSYDATCTACPSGTFTEEENASTCVVWTDCQPGQFAAIAGADYQNRSCEACPEGTSSEGLNVGVCVEDHECPQGSIETSPENCSPCEAGRYCAGAQAVAQTCNADSWDKDLDPATPCIPKTMCSAGQFVQFGGSATEDRVCAPCADGEFSNTLNQTSCMPWRTCPAPASYVVRTATATTDRVCGACGSPTTTFADNQASCGPTAHQLRDGQVVVEVENYVSTSANGAAAGWSAASVPEASSGVYMEVAAVKAPGEKWTRNIATTAPRLVYRINIETPGSYTVYVRGGPGFGGSFADSCWGGFDNIPSSDEFDFTSKRDRWSWEAQTYSLNAGQHTFSLWAREDGVRLDKIVINNTGVAPTLLGPNPSAL